MTETTTAPAAPKRAPNLAMALSHNDVTHPNEQVEEIYLEAIVAAEDNHRHRTKCQAFMEAAA